ncbi:MAG: acyl-phosphate glycerol 3-phosphate acyltransferase [Acidobacteria bacterium]|nr:MAG: acyl-phosphate glycerol 3-phosphate acyltransferase [Acidobacteriota bacterium]
MPRCARFHWAKLCSVLRAVVVLSAYLVGSIPFSYIVARRRGVDVRTVGSGNVGATNVMRSVGRGAGLAAFALDFLKGAAATLVAMSIERDGALPALAAATAVLGHMYPVWLRFRGGKGVATGAGAFLPIAPVPTIAALVAFGLALAATRYVSVGSLVGCATLAALAFALGGPSAVAFAATATALLVLWKHRANLARIARGTESRLGARP